jgi:hypothetical protein
MGLEVGSMKTDLIGGSIRFQAAMENPIMLVFFPT